MAADWVDYATVSMTDAITPKLSARYTCYTDGTDIACNSPSIYVSTDGSIGIGTANPQSQLHISGSSPFVLMTDAEGPASHRVTMFGNDDGNFRIQTRDSAGTFVANDYLIDRGPAGASMHIWRISNSEVMRVGSGNAKVTGTVSVTSAVQLGDSSLACTAPINGAIKYASGALYYCTGTTWTAVSAAGGGQEDRIVSGTTSAIAYNGGSITFTTAGNPRMVVGDTGNVAIGTEEAKYALSLERPGTTNVTLPIAMFRWTDPSSTVAEGGFTAYENSTYMGGFEVFGSNAFTGAGWNSALLLTAAHNDLGKILFRTRSGNVYRTRLTITNAGEVGVGTPSPTATLQISGSFTVSNSAQTTTPSLYVGTSGLIGLGTAHPSSSAVHVLNNAGTDAGTAQRTLFVEGPALSGSGIARTGIYLRTRSTDRSKTYAPIALNGGLLEVLSIGGLDSGMTGYVPISRTTLTAGNALGAGPSIDLNFGNGYTTIGGATVRITSWTAIAANISPSTELDVYGTISATNILAANIVTATYFEGDGSRLTGIASGTADNLGNHTATQALDMAGYAINAAGTVSGTAFYSGDGNAYFYNNGSIPSLVFDTNDYFRFTRSANTLDWLVGGNAKFTVDSTGKLGVLGNGDPQAAVDATGGTVSATTFYGSNGSVSVPAYSFSNDTNSGIYRAAAAVLGFSVGSANVVSISSGGIGTTGLAVAGNVTATGVISASGFVIGANSPAATGAVRYNGTSDTLQVYTGSGWKSLVSNTAGLGATSAASSTGAIQFNSGNAFAGDTSNLFWDDANNRLGIGTSAPLEAIAISTTGANGLSVRDSSPTAYSQIVFYGTSRTLSLGIGNSAAPQGLSNKFFLFDATSATTRIAVDAAGNTGIGTATPTAKLDVNGNVSVTGVIDIGHTALACSTTISGSIRYETTSDTLQICTSAGWKSLTSTTVAAATVDGAGSANHVAYWSDANTLTYDSSQLYWDATNNRLGIGTGSPAYVLDVRGGLLVSGSSAGYYVADRTTGVSVSALYRSGGVTRLWDNVAGDVITYNTAGQVGIGNGAPGTDLGITGSVSATGNLTVAGKVGIATAGIAAVPLEVSGSGDNLRVSKVGGGTNPYLSWYNDGTRQAYMGYGTKNTDFDITTENGTRLDITGNAGIALATATGEIAANDRLIIASNARMTGATSNSIAWSTIGVAAPGAGSAGMKLQLYGGTSNIMATSDYALGIEGGNLWLNTGGGIKFYAGSTLRAEMASTGTISATAFHASNGDSAAAPGHTWIGDVNTGIFHPVADVIGVSINGTERSRIFSTGISTTGVFYASNGSTATPAFNFHSDLNTGMYRAGTDIIGFSTNGVERARIVAGGISTSGVYYSGNGTAAAPAHTFSGDTNNGMFLATTDALGLSTAGTERMRIAANGRVGIGVTVPTAELSVAGSLNTTGNGTFGGFDFRLGNADQSTRGDSGASRALVKYSGAVLGINWGGDFTGGTVVAGYGNSNNLYVSGAANGNVGIGTASPADRLHLDNTDNTYVRIDGGNGYMGVKLTDDGVLKWQIYNSGGTSDRFYVVDKDTNNGVYINQDASAWTANSDRRLKTNIQDYSVLDKIDNGFRAVTFDWKSGGKRDFGVVAQEIYKAFPEVVDKGTDDLEKTISDTTDKSVWGVKYDRLGVLALEGVRELKAENDKLHRLLKAANDNDAALRQQLDELRHDLRELKRAQHAD